MGRNKTENAKHTETKLRKKNNKTKVEKAAPSDKCWGEAVSGTVRGVVARQRTHSRLNTKQTGGKRKKEEEKQQGEAK
eukprot:1756558-Rhodomonas_salina.1